MDIYLVTEPRSKKGVLHGLPNFQNGFNQFFDVSEKPRAAILLRREINSILLNDFTGKDIVSILLPGSKQIIVSIYADGTFEDFDQKLYEVIEYSEKHKISLIISGDMNAHSSLWCSSSTDRRGHILEQIICKFNLKILNNGDSDTFIGARGKSKIDVTLINNYVLNAHDWEVDNEYSGSDHRYIHFSSSSSFFTNNFYRNFKKANWDIFQASLPNGGCEIGPSIPEIDQAACWIENEINKALLLACPPKKALKRPPCPWWNDEIENCRKKIRRLTNHDRFRSRNRSKNKHADEIKELRKEYRNLICKAKNESWKKFCSDLSSAKDISKMAKARQNLVNPKLGLLKNVIKNNNSTSSVVEDNLNALLNCHCPDFLEEIPINPPSDTYEVPPLNSIINEFTVREAILSFSKYKKPGPDGIPAVALQNLNDYFFKVITELMIMSLNTGYTPETWRRSSIIFIPKLGKPDYSDPKAFRPITLSNVILKAMERVLLWSINNDINPLPNQHGFTRGRSTESAISALVNQIEKNLNRKSHGIVVYFDVQAAYDSLSFNTIEQSMLRRGISPIIVKWYGFYLRARTVNCTLNGVSKNIVPSKGTPQGGILSTLAFILSFQDAIDIANEKPTVGFGFADDLAAGVFGPDIPTLINLLQKTINKLKAWADEKEIVFSPSKTKAMLFTRSRKYKLKPIYLGDSEIDYVSTFKYLGVTIDNKLTWNTHIDNVISKAKRVMMACINLLGKDWGLTPARAKWAWETLARPIVSYGSLVWSSAVEKSTIQLKLYKLQRLACLLITKCFKTSPTKGIEAILGLLPLHLFIREASLSARFRTKNLINDRWVGKGHINYLDKQLKSIIKADIEDRIYYTSPNYNVKLNSNPSKKYDYHCFTDGSRELDSGCGWAITKNDYIIEEGNLFLYDATVYQSELKAIEMTLNEIESNKKFSRNDSFLIHSDSLSALMSLKGRKWVSKTTAQIRDKLNTLPNVELTWVKGHNETTGNELADMLAKSGNKTTNINKIHCPIPYTNHKKLIRTKMMSEWQKSWENEPTCEHTKEFVKEVGQFKDLLQYDRNNLSNVVNFMTGHIALKKHLNNIGKVSDDKCRGCMGFPETPSHLMVCERFQTPELFLETDPMKKINILLNNRIVKNLIEIDFINKK